MAQFAEIAFLSTNLTGTTFSFNVFIKRCGEEFSYIQTHSQIPYSEFPVYVNIENVLGSGVECYDYKVVENKTQLSCSDNVLVPGVSPTPSITPSLTPSITPSLTPTNTPTPTPTPEPCLLDCSLSPSDRPCLVSCLVEEAVLDCNVEEGSPCPLECSLEPCLITCNFELGSSCLLDADLISVDSSPSITPTLTPTPTPTPSLSNSTSSTLNITSTSSKCSIGSGEVLNESGTPIVSYDYNNSINSSFDSVSVNIGEKIVISVTSTTISDINCPLIPTTTQVFIDGVRVLSSVSPSNPGLSVSDSISFNAINSSYDIEIILSQ